MKDKLLTVEKSILEEKGELDKYINETINNKSKSLITSPTGTFKTTYAAELVKEKGHQYYFVILEPQISISGQLSHRLKEIGVTAFIYNSKTRKDLDRWTEVNQISGPFCIVSTIDSAWRLFEEGIVDPERTIVIADEFHSFLQNARTFFDKTVWAILDSGCPLIGFTATHARWVSEKLFRVDMVIRVDATDIPAKVIEPILVSYGLAATVARLIEGNEWKKVVIWTNYIRDQKKIKEELYAISPELKMLMLNADTREVSEKESWDNLIKKAELPKDANVICINSVAQAGISIIDSDIDAVILVGQFDPLGFQQYLGRCRNYDGVFYYLHLDYGKDTIEWKGTDEQERFHEMIEEFFNQFSEEERKSWSEIHPLFRDYFADDPENGSRLKRCMVANDAYKSFWFLHGKHLLNIVEQLDPGLIIHEYNEHSIGTTSNIPTARKAQYRKIKKEALQDLIEKNATQLKSIIKFFKRGMSHQAALNIVAESVGNKRIAVRNNVLHVPRNKKSSLIKTIETADQAGVGVQRLLLAAATYIDKYHDTDALNEVLKMSNSKVSKLINAYHFFDKDYPSKSRVKSILDGMTTNISKAKTASEWKAGIKTRVNGYSNQLADFPGTDSFAGTVYDCCFITSRIKVTVNDERKNKQRLDGIVRTYDDYLNSNGLDKIFKSVS